MNYGAEKLGRVGPHLITFSAGVGLTYVMFPGGICQPPANPVAWARSLSEVVAGIPAGLLTLVAIVFAALLVRELLDSFNFAARTDVTSVGPQDKAAAEREDTLSTVAESLEKQVSALLGIAAEHLTTATSRSTVFAGAQANLESANTVAKLRAISELLISTTAAAHEETRELRDKLEMAQAQIAEAGQKLAVTEGIAKLDGLTGLANRRSFDAEFARAVENAHSTLYPLCLVLADIDHFKKINDSYGHPTGDLVLKQFGQLLARNIRADEAMVARYGGEEFAILLHKAPTGNAVAIVERLRKMVKKVRWTNAAGKEIPKPTASFGIAEIKDGDTCETLLSRADTKLYDAKRKGRNRLEVDSSYRQ